MTKPDESKEAKPAKTRSIASLIVILVILSLAGLALKGPFQSLVASRLGTVVWAPIVESIKASDIDPETHRKLCRVLEQVSADAKLGKISETQLYDLSMKLSRRYLAKLIRIQAAARRQFTLNPKLTTEEKARIDTIFRRFSHVILERKLKRRKVRSLYEEWRAYGHRHRNNKISDSEREQRLKELQDHADAFQIPTNIAPVNVLQEFKKAIEEARR
jgi:hypothetical protein